jgi:hypothetical protein
MTFPTADLGFFDILFGFPTVGPDLDLVREEWEWPFEFRTELHMLTGIGSQYGRNRAAAAQAGLPG